MFSGRDARRDPVSDFTEPWHEPRGAESRDAFADDLRTAASAADADADGAPVSPTTANSRSSGAAWRGVRPPIELISPPPPLKNDESMPRVVEFSAAAAGDAEVLDVAAGISILTSRLGGLSEPDPLHDDVSEVRRDAGAEPPTSELGNELGSSFESYSVLGGPEELSEDHCVPSREPSGVAASAPPSSVGGRSESKLWPDCDDRCPIPRPNGDPPRPHALSSPPVRDGGVCSASCRLLAPRRPNAPAEFDTDRSFEFDPNVAEDVLPSITVGGADSHSERAVRGVRPSSPRSPNASSGFDDLRSCSDSRGMPDAFDRRRIHDRRGVHAGDRPWWEIVDPAARTVCGGRKVSARR